MINGRNEPLMLRERNEKEEIEKEEDSRSPSEKCDLDLIIAAHWEELDARWDEQQRIKAGLVDHSIEEKEDWIVLDLPASEEEDQIGAGPDFPTEEQQLIGVVLDLPMGADGEGDALPENFKALIRDMSGTNLILVLEKRLFTTDVRRVENRLSIPANQVRKNFLTEEEEEILMSGEGMRVVLIQPSLEVSTITLKKWRMKNTCYLYVLTSQWNSVVRSESLERDDLVQIWTFRVGRELGFALVRV